MIEDSRRVQSLRAPIGRLSCPERTPGWTRWIPRRPVPRVGSLRMRIYAPRVVADRIMMQDDFVRLHKFLLRDGYYPAISDEEGPRGG